MFGPLRQRDFLLLWAGQTVSLVGDGILSVALAWQALQFPSPATALTVVLVSRAIPRSVMLPFGGALSDRIGRRPVMVVADAVQGVAIGAIAVLSGAGHLEVWSLAALAAVSGAAGAFFYPPLTALIPDLLATEHLLAGNALNSLSRQFASQLLGPALGGLLVASLGTTSAFAIDAASFAVSVGSLVALRVPPRLRETSTGMMADIVEGLRYTIARPWLRVSLVIFGLINLLISGTIGVLVPLLLTQHLGLGAGALGLVLASFGVGAAIAAIAAGQLPAPQRPIRLLYGASALGCVLLGGFGIAPSVWVLAAMVGFSGLLFETLNLVWATLMQRNVPARMLGRVSSLDWFMSLSLTPLGLAIAGPAAAAFGIASTLGVGGLAVAGAITTAFFLPGVRSPDRPDAPADPSM